MKAREIDRIMSKLSPMDEPLNRQDFLTQSWKSLLAELGEWLPGQPESDVAGNTVLRPPGAIGEPAFLSTCEPFCNECRSVCPRDAIFQDELGFPFVQPDTAPCVMCVDVPCTQVCPTGALLPLSSPRQIALGTAVIELTVCTAYQGSGCHVCHDVCPLIEEAIRLNEGLPEIDPDHCTGCGICVYECPTPEAVKIMAARH